jgi:hypothetical protein
MLKELTQLWASLRDAEYLHLVLENLPLYGVACGVLMLLVAQMAGEKKSRLLALLLITACCASVWPYQELRVKAEPRIVATRDPALKPFIDKQTERRAGVNWAFYTMAAVSGLTLLLQMAGKGKPLVFVTLAGALAIVCLSAWLHKKECEVYHRNIVKIKLPMVGS